MFKRNSLFMMSLLLLFSLFLSSPLYSQFSSVRVQVVDVGQADAILIRTPNQKWIVIDAGTNSQFAKGMKNNWGVDTVSLAIVSHRHFDHLGGMDDVLRDFPVKLFLGNMDDCPGNSSDDTVRSIISRKGIPVQSLGLDTIYIDGLSFIILPQAPLMDCPDDENDNSVLVRLEYGNFSMIFPGDAETGELDWFIQNYPQYLDVDVLKASHHGSNNGTSDNWLNAVTPEAVVISAGVNATYKHPQQDAVDKYNAETGGRIYCTNRHGTVRVYGFTDGHFRITTQRHTSKSCVYDGTFYEE